MSNARRSVLLTFTFFCLLAPDLRAGDEATGGTKQPPTSITQVLASLDAAHRRFSPPSDVEEVIARAGVEPQTLCQWVRQNVAYEPYTGVMKGASGALISQRANSADKALLLCELLQRAGFNASLLKGEWGDVKPPATLSPQIPGDTPDDKQLGEFAQAANLSIATAQALLKASQPEREQFQEQLWSRTMRDRDQLASLLQDAGVAVPAITSAAVESSRWWVRLGDVILDPTSDTPAAANSGSVIDVDKLPEADCHRISLRMVIAPHAGETEVVLDVPLRICDVFGCTIAVGATSSQAKGKIEAIAHPSTRAYFDALESASEFQPSLIVFGPAGAQKRVIAGTAFDISGKTIASSSGRTGSAAKLGGAMGGMFGGLSGESSEAPPPVQSLADAWLEVELFAPGTPDPVKIRRDILSHTSGDKAPKQLVLDLLAIREMMVLPEEISSDYATNLLLSHSIAWAEFLQTHPKKNFDAHQMFRLLSDQPHLNERLLSFSMARRLALAQLCQGDFAGESGIKSYAHSRATVVSQLSRLVDDEKGPRVARRLDIIENALVPIGSGNSQHWRANFALTCGAMDTALEHVLIWGTSNASAALDRTQFGEVKPLVINGKFPDQVQIDKSTRAEIEPQLSRSAFIYLPGEKAMWYRVGLTDGNTLGFVQGGGGQEEAEYAETVEILLQLREMISFYGELGRCLGEAISAPLAGEADAHKVLEECFVGLCSMLPTAIAQATGVEASWTSIIITQTINHTFKDFCKKIWEHVGPDAGHGGGGH